MPLIANSKQNASRTIEDFYFDLAKDKSNLVWENIATNMLALIALINKHFPDTPIWGLTSHADLVLQAHDDWNTDWYVVVKCIGNQEYYFEYQLPVAKSPWKNATVKGVAKDFAEAKKYLLISMKESEGWKDCNELNELLKRQGL